MPAFLNPNTSSRPSNPFNPNNRANGPFMPQPQGSQQYAGLVQQQPGPMTQNSDVSVKPPFKSPYGVEIDYALGQIPNPVGPFVPPPTAGLVDQITAIQNQFSQSALPLLQQLLGAQQQQFDIANSFFGPEMALRQGMFDAISQQDTSLLEALLGVQEQLSAGLQPRSGSFYFAGF